MDTLLQDLRYALRSLAKSPGFTAVAALTLAIGIGANSALFTVLYRAVLRTLPVAEPARLVHVVNDRGPDGVNYNLSYDFFNVLRTRSSAFAAVAGHSPLAVAVGLPSGAERVEAAVVSHGFFTMLGTPMTRGRDFLAEEDVVGGPAVVVLGHALWQGRFGGANDVLGTQVTVNGQPFTVVGVAAPSFHGLVAGRSEEMWVPIGAMVRLTDIGRMLTSSDVSWLDVFARLAPGVSLEQAQADVAVLDAQAVQAGQRPATEHTRLLDGSRGLTYVVAWLAQPLRLLLYVVGLLLLLACANVANLLLARAGTRRHEIAIRLALGASRGRLVRQLMTESLVLALLGAAAGLGIARWGVDLLLGYAPPGGERIAVAARLDPLVLGFTLVVAVVTGIAFGLAPALRASRPAIVPDLKGAEPQWHERLFGLRGSLVVVQVAISLALVVGATLFLKSIRNLSRVDIGFAPGSVLLASVDLEQAGYERARGAALLARLLERLDAVPGVDAASAALVITPNPGGHNWSGVRLEGFTPPPNQDVTFDVNKVGPRYFEAMGISLVHGRGFNARDHAGAPLVAVVNESFARRYYGRTSPIGRHIYLGDGPTPAAEIVGIAHDGKYRDLREIGQATVYFPLLQSYAPQVTLVLRASGEPLSLVGAIRNEVRVADPGLPLFGVQTLAQHVATATAQDRMIATLTSLFGLVALLIAALGLFGVIAYGVAQRTREIGVRMALGARPQDVLALIVGRGLALVGVGLIAGLVLALALGRFTASMLYGVAAGDLSALGASVVVLATAAALATYLPARRAARIDPTVALRSE
jgi:predicted permease